MSFTIRDGTRPTKLLCNSCRRGTIIKGPQQGQELIYCAYLEKCVAFPVVECNRYIEHGKMDEYQAEKIGWVLEVTGGKVMGFKRPEPEKL